MKKVTALVHSLVFASFAIPLHQDGNWQNFMFTRIQKNNVSWSKEKILIEVNNSASPLIYPLPEIKKIKSLRVRFKIKGQPIPIKEGFTQGDRNYDDFSLRIGLVKKGNKSLNWFERQLAPDWVLRMHELAPKGLGIEHIHFLVATQQKNLVGKMRLHPLSDYFVEEFAIHAEPDKNITLQKTFKKPLETIALWISCDGDDTSAKYEVEIKEIKLNYK